MGLGEVAAMLSFYPTMIHHNGPQDDLEPLLNHFLALHTLSMPFCRLVFSRSVELKPSLLTPPNDSSPGFSVALPTEPHIPQQ